eukprot:3094214-Amphidinium_carterae.1
MHCLQDIAAPPSRDDMGVPDDHDVAPPSREERSAPDDIPFLTPHFRIMWYKRTSCVAARHRMGGRHQIAQVAATPDTKREAYIAAFAALQEIEDGLITPDAWRGRVMALMHDA